MRSTRLAAWIAVSLGAAAAQAGQIFGTLALNGQPLPAGRQVTVDCSGEVAHTTTDAAGRYRLFVKATGQCTLSLPEYGGATATIASFEEPATFHLNIVQDPGGGYRLEAR